MHVRIYFVCFTKIPDALVIFRARKPNLFPHIVHKVKNVDLSHSWHGVSPLTAHQVLYCCWPDDCWELKQRCCVCFGASKSFFFCFCVYAYYMYDVCVWPLVVENRMIDFSTDGIFLSLHCCRPSRESKIFCPRHVDIWLGWACSPLNSSDSQLCKVSTSFVIFSVRPKCHHEFRLMQNSPRARWALKK
jgi:hypothetical protein